MIMADDSLMSGAKKQYKVLQAAEARLQANLAEYVADGNEDGIAEELGNMTILELQKDKLNQMYNRHVQSQQPAPPARADAWMSKRSDEMTPEDAYQMVNQTSETAKLGGGISREEYINNMRRLQQEKAAGHRQS
jgi:hypothetical protein